MNQWISEQQSSSFSSLLSKDASDTVSGSRVACVKEAEISNVSSTQFYLKMQYYKCNKIRENNHSVMSLNKKSPIVSQAGVFFYKGHDVQ